MAEFDGVSAFKKTAPRRLRDAEELLQPPTLQPNDSDAMTRHLSGAVYLAGYGVECVLKAYIITHNPPHQRLSEVRDVLLNSGALTKDICGSDGHNLGVLLNVTDLEGAFDLRPELKKYWAIARKWTSTLRYNDYVPKREDAAAFVASCRALYQWVNSRL